MAVKGKPKTALKEKIIKNAEAEANGEKRKSGAVKIPLHKRAPTDSENLHLSKADFTRKKLRRLNRGDKLKEFEAKLKADEAAEDVKAAEEAKQAALLEQEAAAAAAKELKDKKKDKKDK